MVALNDGKQYIQLGNVLVEKDAMGIAQAIKDYDPDLDLICLDPNSAAFTSAPFMVVWRSPQGHYEKVLEAWELDRRILERLYVADQHKTDTLATIEQWEERNRKLSQSRYEEKLGDNNQLLEAAITNKKSSFTFDNEQGDRVKINDVGPVEKNNNKKSF